MEEFGVERLEEIAIDGEAGFFRECSSGKQVFASEVSGRRGVYELSLPNGGIRKNLAAWCHAPAMRHAPPEADYFAICHPTTGPNGHVMIQYYTALGKGLI